MRIVLATLYEQVGGSTRVLLAAADALRRDHAVTVRAPIGQADSVTPRPVSSKSLETWGDKLAILPDLGRAFVSELRWIGARRPEAIYVHDELSLYVYGLIGRILGARVVWHVHMREGRPLARRLRDALCDAKIFVSRFIVGEGQRRPFVVIRNPVAVGEATLRLRGTVLQIGMVGSISVLKNQELAVRVIAELSRRGIPARLLIFGEALDERYRERVETLIAEQGLGNAVSLRGFVPIEQALSELDVLLSCSTYESFGLATVETLGRGIPVVASDIPAHREIADILGTRALALAPLDAAAMADAILAATPDPQAPERVRAEFAHERFAADIAGLFPRLLSAPTAGDLRTWTRNS
jgi:glycosyltransferase involved in cell wall biosynthesis